ncbi:hypothetical protein LTI14_02265 [Nesterenkonia sp. YGD6]|uniref:hypothetical protein n=1 Tax=Nesterenkonia sp. YGD6 TaxID=2901231 RepID=UPI001F4CCC09|nr:hypothetical protein [Nesterenkonia sp. YGD6]MCH8562045.1 hypothetical protein [Nesterenkonia sp. YGD6]
MDPGTLPAEWKDVFVLDARTIQLGAGDRAVRIIGPARQTLKRLQEPVSVTRGEEAADDGDSCPEQGCPRPAEGCPPTAAAAIRVQARRQLAAVLIDGLPRPAALLAEQLTRLPLGLLLLRDDHLVDRADVAAGYPAAAVGLTRAVAVRRSCLRQDPEAAVITCSAPARQTSASAANTSLPIPHTPPALPQEPVDIQVIFARRAVAPARLSAAAARAQLVLPVVRHPLGTGPDQWQIGPLLSRDHGPCPQCLQLHGAAADPHWDTVQTALAGQHPTANPPLDQEDPQSATVVASLLAREVQLAIDGEVTPQTASRMIGLSASTGKLSLEHVSPHPECACRLNTPVSE